MKTKRQYIVGYEGESAIKCDTCERVAEFLSGGAGEHPISLCRDCYKWAFITFAMNGFLDEQE